MPSIHDNVAENLARLRTERAWSAEVAAAELRIPPALLSAIEAHRHALSLAGVEVLAERLGVDVWRLLRPLSGEQWP